MGTLNERSGENLLAKEKTKHRIRIIIYIIIGVLIIGYIAYWIWDSIRNKEYHTYTVEASYDKVDGNTVVYKNYGDNILKYSRDGAMAMDSDGNTLWNGSFEMQSPMVDCCDDFVAIADESGKEIYVFNGSDSGTKIDVPLPIKNIRVASQGVVAVVLEDERSNTINLYDPYSNTEKLLVEVPTNVKTDGYPVDIALSRDGQSLVTSYLSVDNGVTDSKVCFYNFSEVGQDKNRIVGGKTYDTSMAVKLEFIGDDTLCVFLDNGFEIFKNMKQPEEIHSEHFDKEIKSAVYQKGYVGYVFEQSDGESRYDVKLYDTSGDVVLNTSLDYEYERVYMEESDLIFLSEKDCHIIKKNGVCKFDGVFDTGVKYLFGTGSGDTYFMIDDKMIRMIELKEEERT